MAETTVVDKDYIDSTSVKKFVTDTLVDKYFPEIDPDLRTVGVIGYTSELISDISEDAFNTGSLLFNELFPNRSLMDESIYSHAAIFQLDTVMSSAASCKFVLVIDEDAVIKNMERSKDTNSRNKYYFYIDKNTTFFVEGIPFTLDYDIMLTIVKKITSTGEEYLYSGRYVLEEYSNSISDITDPYVKIRKTGSGVIVLEAMTHQVVRDIYEDTILSNSDVNYPVIDVVFTEEKLAGFDVLVRAPGETEYEQMETLITYSQPLKTPFCYYQMVNRDTLRISFNTRDTYYIPEFNSDIQVILYYTNGESGNFDVYNGNNIELSTDSEKYDYQFPYLMTVKPVGAAQGGSDQESIDGLQESVVTAYRTANAITTESDLREFFNNITYYYGDTNILFLKKRDDIFERVFSAFMISKTKDGDIYKTSTMDIDMNIYDMNNTEKDTFILEPGTVFTCDDVYKAKFLRDSDLNESYRSLYNEAVESGDALFIPADEVNQSEIPSYLDRSCSFAQWKSRNNLSDNRYVWDLTDEDFAELDNPNNDKFLLINPFLLKFTKNPNLVSTYMTYVDNEVSLDFSNINDQMYVQFVIYTMRMNRRFEKDKKYSFELSVAPTMTVSEEDYPLINMVPISLSTSDATEEETNDKEYVLNNPYNLDQNDLRIVMAIYDNNNMICFSELVPTEYDAVTNSFKFGIDLYTDDHISSTGRLRLLENTIYRNNEDGTYYKVQDNDKTMYDKYDADGNIIESFINNNDVMEMYNNGTLKKYSTIVNTSVYDDVLIPTDNVVVRIYTLYKRNYSEEAGGMIENSVDNTNNPFAGYGYEGYIWTNEYRTNNEPLVFMKNLESVRSYIDFEDYTEAVWDEEQEKVIFKHDIFDVNLKSVSFIQAATVRDTDAMDYFFKVFYNRYQHMSDIIDTRLRNETGIDLKFYRTYGKSANYIIGEDNEIINTVNVHIEFDMWFESGTDLITAIPEIKTFIKDAIETISDEGMNSIHISNLMREIEDNFAYVDHIRFKGINSYDTTYQSVKNVTTDINDLSVEDRRWYVPELLTVDMDDIVIYDYII